MDTRDKLYIDGSWVPSAGKGAIDVTNATTEEVMGRVPEGTPADVEKAVAAARAAAPSWASTSVDDRVKYVHQLSEALQARTEEIAKIITGEVGTPFMISQIAQAGLPAMMAGSYVQIAQEFPWEEQIGNSTVVREPIGVVGCITPWNYPLHQVVAKIAPALTAGCTIVLKPSEVAPLTAFVLADIFDDIGLPKGVFNLVTGTGPVVGEALVTNPDVDMISFTGSTRAGKRVMELASQQVKKVALELGGKSPFIALEDAPADEAVKAGLSSCYLNGGQTCIAWTRMLVPESRKDEFVAAAKAEAESFQPGDPMEMTTKLGPMISETQRERVRGYIEKGVEEGATLVTGGAEAPDGLEKGYFVRPTVFADVSNDMTIAQEEIFGPVLSIITYKDEDDAVRIANDTLYGLHAGVYGGDKEHAKEVGRRVEAGQVDINGQGFNPLAPFGGYKQSGIGREYGKYGLEEFLQVKSLQSS
ncbi:MAG TPA: aldehyde dehydrogenase family protein [Acidimicrobiia bacterium]|nr:aldehyde dehydrogenase family protein [Acidimicrobiia bacterium]